MRALVGVVIVTAGCGRIGFDASGDASSVDATRGDGSDPVALGPFGPWQQPVRQASLNSNSQEFGPTLSADGLEVIYGTRRTGNADLWRATRISRVATFGAPALIPELMTAGEDAEPTLSRDGATIVFERYSPLLALWTATRSGTTWSAATTLQPTELADFSGADFGPGDLSLVVQMPNGLFEATRPTTTAAWRTPVSLGITYSFGGYGSMRSDGLEIYWEENPSGAEPHIFRATRASRDEPFGTAEPVDFGSVFSVAGCGDPDLSEDGQVMVFVSNAVGGMGLYDIYETKRDPL